MKKQNKNKTQHQIVSNLRKIPCHINHLKVGVNLINYLYYILYDNINIK